MSQRSDVCYRIAFESDDDTGLLENTMRVAGIILIVVGIVWIVMCFVGIAMMSRSVDMFAEAFPPSLPGFAAIGMGLWMRRRA